MEKFAHRLQDYKGNFPAHDTTSRLIAPHDHRLHMPNCFHFFSGASKLFPPRATAENAPVKMFSPRVASKT